MTWSQDVERAREEDSCRKEAGAAKWDCAACALDQNASAGEWVMGCQGGSEWLTCVIVRYTMISGRWESERRRLGNKGEVLTIFVVKRRVQRDKIVRLALWIRTWALENGSSEWSWVVNSRQGGLCVRWLWQKIEEGVRYGQTRTNFVDLWLFCFGPRGYGATATAKSTWVQTWHPPGSLPLAALCFSSAVEGGVAWNIWGSGMRIPRHETCHRQFLTFLCSAPCQYQVTAYVSLYPYNKGYVNICNYFYVVAQGCLKTPTKT